MLQENRRGKHKWVRTQGQGFLSFLGFRTHNDISSFTNYSRKKNYMQNGW